MNPTYTIQELAKAANGKLRAGFSEMVGVQQLLTDSRKLQQPLQTLFFAIAGGRLDGHNYIADLIERGVRNFVVTDETVLEKFPTVNFVVVKNAVTALQKIAGFHRMKFSYPVIGITGSNGKTIVKEWLYQLLHEDFNIVRNPKSYNSQIGVPLSLWQMTAENNLGIFEAGISESGEMENLKSIIQPTLGIFTNIGEAHNEGFLNAKHKTKEKLKLFTTCELLIYCKDHPEVNQSIAEINAMKGEEDKDRKTKAFTWSQYTDSDLAINSVFQQNGHSFIAANYKGFDLDFEIPFTDKASVENAIHCACVMLVLGKEFSDIKTRMKQLTRIAMRLEMKDAINNCSLINDSYNSDIESLRIAIDFLSQQNQHPKKTLILSDILQSGKGELELYSEVAKLIEENKIQRLIGIGSALKRQLKNFEKNEQLQLEAFETTDEFLKNSSIDSFQNEVILLKGARKFEFEKIAKALEKKAHQTVLEINLNALVNNLKAYQSLLLPDTKIMAMVKAFSYGSGSYEIANVLQFNRVNYLAVAYADEGVELRKSGIALPIMVMNPEERSFDTLIHHHLEPDIYSLSLLDNFINTLKLKRGEGAVRYKIHVELETGMNRLGFEESDVSVLVEKIQACDALEIASVFSHLAASEDESYNDFTKKQIEKFEKMSDIICKNFDYKILRHILNSNGISHHTTAQFDMVRLGIGLYGLDSLPQMQAKLLPVSTLKTTVSQIKHIKAGDTVGYGRVGKAKTDRTIATIGIGYADGLSRKLSNGRGKMLIGNKEAPIIGNVCMDMCMLDITDIEEVQEGDEVIVFGTHPRVEELAKTAETIPYEILTGISARVKRVYFQE